MYPLLSEVHVDEKGRLSGADKFPLFPPTFESDTGFVPSSSKETFSLPQEFVRRHKSSVLFSILTKTRAYTGLSDNDEGLHFLFAVDILSLFYRAQIGRGDRLVRFFFPRAAFRANNAKYQSEDFFPSIGIGWCIYFSFSL